MFITVSYMYVYINARRSQLLCQYANYLLRVLLLLMFFYIVLTILVH